MTNSIQHQFHFKVQPAAICAALTQEEHLRKWWTKHASVQNGKGVFRWPGNGWTVELTIEPPDGGREVVWTCNQSNMQNTDAWEGTTLTFKLTPEAGGTKVEFSQTDYKNSPCYDACVTGWNYFLGNSLKNYLENGKGTPYPDLADNSLPGSNREVVTTRVFNVSRELLFKAWSDRGHMAEWWGPKGFTNTFHEYDFRAKGVWRFTMHGPDGKDYENKSVFTEVVRNERIVFEHLEPVHKFLATATFEMQGNKTQLTFRMRFETEEECQRVKAFVTQANEENFDRLEAELKRML